MNSLARKSMLMYQRKMFLVVNCNYDLIFFIINLSFSQHNIIASKVCLQFSSNTLKF